MGKYLMLWEMNRNLIPLTAKERGQGYMMLMAMVQEDIKKGLSKDWGCFVGEGNGYCVVEGSEVDICKMVQQYSPYCRFITHPIATAEQMGAVIKSLAG
jgi:hypothetical protein